MNDEEQIERSSARYATIIGVALLTLYGASAALWALNAPDPQEEPVLAATE